LEEEGRKFIAKVNSRWFPELTKIATESIGENDSDFVVLWSDVTEEHFMMYNSRGKKGKMKRKCVFTNAFVNVPAPKSYIGIIVHIRTHTHTHSLSLSVSLCLFS
jgi:hypothetical protein